MNNSGVIASMLVILILTLVAEEAEVAAEDALSRLR